MKNSEFVSRLSAVATASGDKERQVEAAYNEMLRDAFPGIVIENPFKCDGFFRFGEKKTGVICEYKYDLDMTSKVVRSQVLAQILFYLKKFENSGEALPAVAFVGDVNECFVVHTNHLIKFLDFDCDWNQAPSHAGQIPELVAVLASDDERNAYVFSVGNGFDFAEIADKIRSTAENVKRLLRITPHNVDKAFEVFSKLVTEKKVSSNDMVAAFFGTIADRENYYLHPTKKNQLVTPRGGIAVSGAGLRGFLEHFATDYTPAEKSRLASISDRLIEDSRRRREGAFFTPTPFVDYAHKMAEREFGENWRDEYVVVDPCCGTKNLTRDYRFKELYCSTLEQAELDISRNYNPEAVSFQFDFLNDPLEDLEKKAPGLMRAFRENKKIIWLFNPPYGRSGASSGGSGFSGIETGSAITKVNHEMKDAKIGACSANLFAQFLFRIMQIKKQFNLTNCNIALFCNPIFMSGPTFEKFRTVFLNNFKFNSGILFNAGYFGDVMTNWGITFNIWLDGNTADKNNFQHNVIDVSNDGELLVSNVKNIYNVDNNLDMAKWSRELTDSKKTTETINLTSAIAVKTSGNCLGKLTDNAIGYLYSHSNVVGKSQQQVAMFSAAFGNGNGFSITPENFKRSCIVFSTRRLSECDYINFQDQYMKPNTDDPRYQEFENDALVFSLFESKSQQSSLRDVEYKGKTWNVKNEFFWMPKAEIQALANEARLDRTYADARTDSDRYMFKELSKTVLSDEAKAVLDKASEIVHKTMKFRELFDDEHKEYQILNWDCGWYQIKALVKQYAPEDLKEFKELYKKLADKMRPIVYELGFLKK